MNNYYTMTKLSKPSPHPRPSFHSQSQQIVATTPAEPHHCWKKVHNANELFVGNLSFFCQEQDLYGLVLDIFDEIYNRNSLNLMQPLPVRPIMDHHQHISAVRIVRSDDGSRSLLFGFVTLNNKEVARLLLDKMQGRMFMGRNLK